MKAFNYSGSGILSFSYGTRDFVAHGKGPHVLPEEAPNVAVLIKKGELKEAQGLEADEAKVEFDNTETK